MVRNNHESEGRDVGGEYTGAQIAAAVQHRLVDFSGFIDGVRQEVKDPRLLLHVDRLLRQIYLHHLDDKYMSKMQACRMIPAEHIDTCKKYVTEAERLGFFKFVDDKSDKRKTNIVPTSEFIHYVENRAVQSLDLFKRVLSE